MWDEPVPSDVHYPLSRLPSCLCLFITNKFVNLKSYIAAVKNTDKKNPYLYLLTFQNTVVHLRTIIGINHQFHGPHMAPDIGDVLKRSVLPLGS